MLRTLKEIKSSNEARVNKLYIIKGEPKIGKTTFAGTFPKPLLHIEIGNEAGAIVLKNVKDIDLIEKISNFADLISILNELKTDDKYNTIVIDPISSVYEMLEVYMRKAKGKALSFDEWGMIKDMMFNMFDIIDEISAKKNVVLLSHTKMFETTDKLTEEKSNKLIPLMSENVGIRMEKTAFFITYLTRIKEETKSRRVAMIGTTDVTTTGIRLANTNDLKVNIDPIYTNINKIIDELK